MMTEAFKLRLDLWPGCYFIALSFSVGIDPAAATLLIEGKATARQVEESAAIMRMAANRLSMTTGRPC